MAGKYAGVAVLIAALAGCDGMPVVTAYKLRNVDPETTQAEAIRVAVAVPQGLRALDGAMNMLAQTRQGDTLEELRFALVPVVEPLDGISAPQGATVSAYRIAPDDLRLFDVFRQQMAQQEEESEGSLTVDTVLCRESAEMPESVPISIYLKAHETNGFVTLVAGEDLLAELSTEDRALALPRCGAKE